MFMWYVNGEYPFLSSIAFTPLIMTYIVEILPEDSRAKRFNIFNVTNQIAVIINKYVNPIFLDYFGWKCYVCLIFLSWH
jgi:MFS family permease